MPRGFPPGFRMKDNLMKLFNALLVIFAALLLLGGVVFFFVKF